MIKRQNTQKIMIIEKIDNKGKIYQIEIFGFDLKPIWKRWMLALCWWINPKIIINNPKIIKNNNMECLFG